MDFKAIDLRQWWMGLVTFGAVISVASIAARHAEALLIGLGIAAIGFGEWISHPLQTKLSMTAVMTAYPRRMKVSGIVLDLVGIALLALGLWRLVGV